MVDDMTDDPLALAAPVDPVAAPVEEKKPDPPEKVKALVSKITKTIKADLLHHEKAFDRMKRDMFVARNGREETWDAGNYHANIVGRHIKQKTASLYAKNPRAVAKRKETIDFQIWDEDPESLMLAMQIVQAGVQAGQMAAAAGPTVDPETGMVMPPEPQLPPGFEEAQALIADFQQGMQRRQLVDKIGKTMEILFANALKEQKPLDFKMAAKKMVRRACTTSVGYIEVGFQREMGPSPAMTERLADARQRLDHLKRLAAEATDKDILDTDAEMAELEASVAALQSEPEIVLREGLIFDFPRSTKVIPDRLCTSLVGFIGARHLTLEYDFTVDEVKERFGVDLKKGKSYTDKNENELEDQPDLFDADKKVDGQKNGLVRVWKHYDKPSGLVYYLTEGHDDWLRPPDKPDVFVEDFWPVYALTFNDVESETELFPPSDVALLMSMQNEYNRSRQGMREHRQAARPRWGYSNGALEEDDIEKLKKMKPFEALGLNIAQGTKLLDILQTIPVPGVDPNLYETNQLFTDMQLAVGTQEAQLGGVSKSSATEAAIAQGSSSSADSSSSDDLDALLTQVARAAGQILLKEMSEEQVKLIAGPGAVWPHETLADIAGEIALEVEMGSSGKPNQAVEMANWERMLPFLIQMPGIKPLWLGRETLRRLDDRMDLTSALVSGIPSIVAQNANAQPQAADPGADPKNQGGQGAQNGPSAPGGPTGSGPAFGSNQV